jgi:hypothetical protein
MYTNLRMFDLVRKECVKVCVRERERKREREREREGERERDSTTCTIRSDRSKRPF